MPRATSYKVYAGGTPSEALTTGVKENRVERNFLLVAALVLVHYKRFRKRISKNTTR